MVDLQGWLPGKLVWFDKIQVINQSYENIMHSSFKELSDEEILREIREKRLSLYKLEEELKGDYYRSISIRRSYIQTNIDNIPYLDINYYDVINGACGENLVGFIPVPVGIAGPLLIDDIPVWIPLATTEGALTASVNRGCRALRDGFGVKTICYDDGISRGPVLEAPDIAKALEAKIWIESHFSSISDAFNSTSKWLSLKSIKVALGGRLVYLRFKSTTGNAMGMNMISLATQEALNYITNNIPSLKITSLSGNYCIDKKASALNWIEGRGKSVIAEAIITKNAMENVLKVTKEELLQVWKSKNMIGSIMAGGVSGSQNAHAANIVTAIFIATGQDVAQVVESSSCMTLMEESKGNQKDENNEGIYITCTMPSIEVGVIGGGTILPPQKEAIKMIMKSNEPSSERLARVIVAAVLAGEISLLSSLAQGTLVNAHLKHNRSKNK